MNYTTGIAYSAQNIIFEKKRTNYIKGTEHAEWNDNVDLPWIQISEEKMNTIIDNATMNKLTNLGEGLSTDGQDDINDSSNVMALENLIEIEVAEEVGRVKNIE